MLVYRVGKDTPGTDIPCGPYTWHRLSEVDSPQWVSDMCQEHGDCRRHVSPIYEFGYPKQERELWAFTSIGDLERWFFGFMTPMGEDGFFILTYEVAEEYVTEHEIEYAFSQCSFMFDNAELVEIEEI